MRRRHSASRSAPTASHTLGRSSPSTGRPPLAIHLGQHLEVGVPLGLGARALGGSEASCREEILDGAQLAPDQGTVFLGSESTFLHRS